jgi:hypothetical protein
MHLVRSGELDGRQSFLKLETSLKQDLDFDETNQK